jgi:phage recombination protein Bet
MTGQAVAVVHDEWDQGTLDLLKRTVAAGTSNDEFDLFCRVAQRAGLDPFARQIYAVMRSGRMTIQTGIDGYRLIADRTGKYAGNDDPRFDEGADGRPVKATVTVWKLVGGERVPFTASARWDEYFPGEKQGTMWQKMPHTMLAKCAEALALRKAFPADLSGIYTAEELDQADTIPVESRPAKRTPRAKTQPAELPAAEQATVVISDAQYAELVALFNDFDPAHQEQVKREFGQTFGHPKRLPVDRVDEAAEWVATWQPTRPTPAVAAAGDDEAPF